MTVTSRTVMGNEQLCVLHTSSEDSAFVQILNTMDGCLYVIQEKQPWERDSLGVEERRKLEEEWPRLCVQQGSHWPARMAGERLERPRLDGDLLSV